MNTVITIGRQFGSGGRANGEMLAKKYGIKCYDKELIARVAKESGLSAETIEHQDERPTTSFLYNLVMDTYSFGYSASGFVDMPISHKIFLAQFDTIKKIASEGPCILVGRCADYALSDLPNVVHIFISSDESARIAEIRRRYKDIDSDGKAQEMMRKKDKQRKNYYNYYSSKKWGHVDSYDLTVNSVKLGFEGSAELISQFVDDFEKRQKAGS